MKEYLNGSKGTSGKKFGSPGRGLLPMRVVEEERVESGEGLGRKVLATESTDSREEHL